MRRVLSITLIAFTALLIGQPARAVNRIPQNPADINLLESVFVNPALNPWLSGKASISGTFYHPAVSGDFTGVSGGTFGLHMPRNMRGVAFGINYLGTNLYRETNLRGSYGHAFGRHFSAGISLDLAMLDYDQLSFYRFNFADPLIQDTDFRFVLSGGMGLFWRPSKRLQFGLNVDDINRPNLSTSGQWDELRHINIGALYKLDEWWSVRAAAVNLANNNFSSAGEASATDEILDHVEVGVGRSFGHGSQVRLTLGPRAIWSELEFHMLSDWYFNYRFDYPLSEINLVSTGTHRFGVVYDVYQRPELPTPRDLPALPIHDAADVEWPLPHPRGQLYVYTPREELIIRHLHSLATISGDLGPVEMSNLRPRDLGDERSMVVRETLPDLPGGRKVVNRPPQGMYSPEYLGALETMGYYLRRKQAAAELVAPQHDATRARGLEQVITGGGYQVEDEIPIRSEFVNELAQQTVDSLAGAGPVAFGDRLVSEVPFYVVKPFTEEFSGAWRFLIRDVGRDRIIFDVGSPTELPDVFVWTGQYPDGSLLPSGIYEYMLTYQRPDGGYEMGGQGRLNVVHHQVYKDIDIRSDMEDGDQRADDFELILSPERR